MSKLAIVIPAYKSTFLKAALDSIAAQTCKDFRLYIGDDCSPHDLKSIVDEYTDKIDLTYQRFDQNLGGKDLVAQWERCIDMTQGEEWLWLFSDDDVMEPNCVEEFYKTLQAHPEAGLIHFNLAKLISKTGEVKKIPPFPEYCPAKMYLDEKIKGHFISMVVEFIVRRDIFFKAGRFQNFDMAWGSDFCSWVKFSHAANGIWTCPSAKVLWRSSGENISTDYSNEAILRKTKAVIYYEKWITDFARSKGYGRIWFYGKYAIGQSRRERKRLSKEQYKKLVNTYESINNWQWPFNVITKLAFYL